MTSEREVEESAKAGRPEGLCGSLVSLVGADNVSWAEEELEEYAADATRGFRILSPLAEKVQRPWAVVHPTSTEQVAAVVQLAARQQIPVVPYGGGSGLMGGAVSLRPGIVIDLKRMNRILRISPQDQTVCVEAGIILERLAQELKRHRLLLGHDPWSRPIATVGGAISTNGLGYTAGKYGSMGDQVLGLVVVLPDGNILRTRAVPQSSAGPHLNHLFIGAEGTMGIITEAVLKVFPIPEKRSLHCFYFPSFEEGFRAIVDMLTLGLNPSVVDFGDEFSPPFWDKIGWPRPGSEEPPVLYLGFEGLSEEVEAQERRGLAICQQWGGRDQGQKKAQEFWKTRHAAAERWAASRARARASQPSWPGERSIRLTYVHVTVPTSRVLEYRQRCCQILEEHDAYLLETGIWGRPEIFSMIMAKMAADAQTAEEEMRQIIDTVLRLAQEMGGSMEHAHGVGLRLAHLMAEEHGYGLAVMRSIKRALDPHNIMNPGKLALTEP